MLLRVMDLPMKVFLFCELETSIRGVFSRLIWSIGQMILHLHVTKYSLEIWLCRSLERLAKMIMEMFAFLGLIMTNTI